MFNAETAHKIALRVCLEPVEEQIRIAVNQGKFLVYIYNLHTEAAEYFRELGYEVRWDTGKSAFITWYSK